MFNIESPVGSGAQHHVGRLGDGLLIKYPHSKGRYWDDSTYQTVMGDLRTHEDYGTPIPETRVIRQPLIDDGKAIIAVPYAIITEEVRGRVFREADLADEGIREQIHKLTADSLAIRGKSGAGIDFLGGAAFGSFLEYLTRERRPLQLGAYNVLVDTRNRINLIDTSLLDPERAPAGRAWPINGLVNLQNGLMTHILEDGRLMQRYLDGQPGKSVQKIAAGLFRLTRRIEKSRQQKQMAA